MRQLVLEAVVVGAVLAVVLALAVWLLPRAFASAWKAGLAGFVLGVAVHLGFELAGLNRVYCDVGHACVTK